MALMSDRNRAKWKKTAHATLAEVPATKFYVQLIGPHFSEESGCTHNTETHKSIIEALYEAFDFCDKNKIRITEFTASVG